ncbi:MAG: serine/threonine protein kinase [Myxococcota bacterium]|jgi:serine/threonine protein kinase
MTNFRGDLGRYIILSDPPRRGGQALVHRAYGPDGALVAIKVARAADEGPWMRRERDALHHIHHKQPGAAGWLVSLLDAGETDDGRTFLVLPWAERTLRDLVEQDDPPLQTRLALAAQACRALALLHRSADIGEALVHRDVKPANFLIVEGDAGPWVVLSDLGGVKAGRVLSAGPNTGLHTAEFAPPEQLLPLELAPDPSMDVHALGVTLYWLLASATPRATFFRAAMLTEDAAHLIQLHSSSRRTPEDESTYAELRGRTLDELFDFESAEALTRTDERLLHRQLTSRLREADIAEPDEIADEMVEALLPTLRRALQPDPRRRLADPGTLFAACRRCTEIAQWSLDLSTTSTPAPPQPPAPAPPSHRSLGLGVGAGGLLFLLAAAGVSYLLPPAAEMAEADVMSSAIPPDPEPESAPEPAPVEPPAPAPEVLPEPAAAPAPVPAPAPVAVAAPTHTVRLRVTHARGLSPSVSYDDAPQDATFDARAGTHTLEVRQPGERPCEVAVSMRASEGQWVLSVGGRQVRSSREETVGLQCLLSGDVEILERG